MNFSCDMDFVVFNAEKIREDNNFFAHQKRFLESQIKASQSLFSHFSEDENKSFEESAREYLKERGIIK